MNKVVAIDVATGEITRRIAVLGAPFLNDIDVDETSGHVYVTDTFGNTIWHIAANRARSS